ncbi:type IV secretion system protein VirD4, partial [Xanthomonas citri pv. citri]|nr:type IV secretion system protein VirD4 [Xanthomonas citri pv. citri]
AILDAPGPVITTSSRADNLGATAELRKAKGPVALFDPQGLTGQPSTLKWSPITGCEEPRVANQRAASLIGASGLGSSSSNAEWQAPAITIMECLLHAAALGE